MCRTIGKDGPRGTRRVKTLSYNRIKVLVSPEGESISGDLTKAIGKRVFLKYLFIYLFIYLKSERDLELEHGRGRRVGERESQAGSTPSTQSQTQSSNPRTMRS